jgi:uncharacterized membrane protein YidH (DUF202 family)
MKVTEPHIVYGALALLLWLLGYLSWSSANSDLKLQSPRLYNQQRRWWLAAVLIVVGFMVVYHLATHGLRPPWVG